MNTTASLSAVVGLTDWTGRVRYFGASIGAVLHNGRFLQISHPTFTNSHICLGVALLKSDLILPLSIHTAYE